MQVFSSNLEIETCATSKYVKSPFWLPIYRYLEQEDLPNRQRVLRLDKRPVAVPVIVATVDTIAGTATGLITTLRIVADFEAMIAAVAAIAGTATCLKSGLRIVIDWADLPAIRGSGRCTSIFASALGLII